MQSTFTAVIFLAPCSGTLEERGHVRDVLQLLADMCQVGLAGSMTDNNIYSRSSTGSQLGECKEGNPGKVHWLCGQANTFSLQRGKGHGSTGNQGYKDSNRK